MIRKPFLVLFLLPALCFSISLYAQVDGGGGIDGGGGGVVDGGGGAVDGGAGAGGMNDMRAVGDLNDMVGQQVDDDRVQPFVGPTGDSIQNPGADFPGLSPGFVGPTGELLEQASGGGATVNRTGGTPGRGSALGQTNGFVFTRSSLRGRLVPSFDFTPVPTNVVANRFQERLPQLPIAQRAAASGVNVQVSGTTAVISGRMNQGAADELMAQLRLEPGIYRIINNMDVGTPSNQNGSRSGFSSPNN